MRAERTIKTFGSLLLALCLMAACGHQQGANAPTVPTPSSELSNDQNEPGIAVGMPVSAAGLPGPQIPTSMTLVPGV